MGGIRPSSQARCSAKESFESRRLSTLRRRQVDGQARAGGKGHQVQGQGRPQWNPKPSEATPSPRVHRHVHGVTWETGRRGKMCRRGTRGLQGSRFTLVDIGNIH